MLPDCGSRAVLSLQYITMSHVAKEIVLHCLGLHQDIYAYG